MEQSLKRLKAASVNYEQCRKDVLDDVSSVQVKAFKDTMIKKYPQHSKFLSRAFRFVVKSAKVDNLGYVETKYAIYFRGCKLKIGWKIHFKSKDEKDDCEDVFEHTIYLKSKGKFMQAYFDYISTGDHKSDKILFVQQMGLAMPDSEACEFVDMIDDFFSKIVLPEEIVKMET